jgi:hypothetical protein
MQYSRMPLFRDDWMMLLILNVILHVPLILPIKGNCSYYPRRYETFPNDDLFVCCTVI